MELVTVSMSNQFKEPLLHIATLGKTVGILGDMKLHIKTDFPEQFFNGASFLTNLKSSITLREVDIAKGLVKLEGIFSPEDAKKFTNAKIFTTREETRKNCHLEEDEYFWFDLEDCKVIEDNKVLGVVHEIERIANTNYLHVKTDSKLVEEGFAKLFLIPFQKPFKQSVDIDLKQIVVSGGMDILEAS